MAEYNTRIVIHAEMDNQQVKEGAEEIEKALDEVEKKAEEKTDIGVKWDEEAQKEFEERIARILKKKKELAAQEVSVAPADEEPRIAPYDWNGNREMSQEAEAEVEAYLKAAERSAEEAQRASEHFNQLRVDVEEYAKSLKELEEQGQYFGDADYDRVYLAWKDADDDVRQYVKDLNRQTGKGKAEEAERAAKAAEKQAAAEAKVEEKLKAQEVENQFLNQIRQEAVPISQNLIALLQEQENITRRIADLKKAGRADGYQEYEELRTRLGEISEEIRQARDGFGEAGKSARKLFDSISRGTKKSGGLLGTLKNRLKGLAISLLIFNQITKIFNAMISAMKEGFKNLTQYSAEYNKNMSDLKSESEQLKNGLAAAFEPIVNMAVPYLTMLVSWANRTAESMSKLLAVMQGKTTYTRARKQMVDYAKSLDTAKKAAKGALASFDELNVLSKNEDNASGALTGEDAFETVTLTEEDMQILDVVKEKLENILVILQTIGVLMAVFGIGGPLGEFVGTLLIVIGLLKFGLEYLDAWTNGISFDNLNGMLIGMLAVLTGVYLLFGPLAAGLTLLVSGIALVVLAIKDMLDNGTNAANMLTLAIGLVTALVAIFLVFGSTVAVIVGAIVAVIAIFAALIAIAGNGEEAIAALKSMCKNFADFFKKIFAGDIEGAMESLKKAGKDLVNVLIIAFESLVNCLVKGLNWLIDKINSVSFDVPDWVPIIGGDSLSPNIPRIPEAKLPRLAKGAVIQGGQPFAAILGDQPAGQTNIETPLATMIEAFKQAQAETGGGQYTFIAQLDGGEIFRQTVKQNQMYRKQTGRSAFLT